ncbi:UNVERIFIED_CONTAM: hypothetical protein HDU68_012663 [Siphonaria sp. JEL0065]|nr:hypothetical protein HDU68_012663 [Siphonaria sp. JEL0065]
MTKLRILCLHGIVTNSKIMQFQLQGLKMALGGDKDVDFVIPDAPFIIKEEPNDDIVKFFGKEGPFYSWVGEAPNRSYEASLPYLQDIIDNEGPFNAICGFSQGTAMATVLTHYMIKEAGYDEALFKWRGLIMFCGVEPEAKYLSQEVITELEFPSVHVIGESDMKFSGRGELLYQVFEADHRKELFYHAGGHHFPTPFKNPIYDQIAIAKFQLPTATAGAVPQAKKSASLVTSLLVALSLAAAWFLYCHRLDESHSGKEPTPGDAFGWKPCPSDPGVECGTLFVPLDRSKPAAAFIGIALARVKALNTEEPKLGSVLINPGGPGGSGKSTVLYSGKALASLIGGRHDVIGFDPRGIAESHSVRCFESAFAHAEFDLMESTVGVPGSMNAKVSDVVFAKTQEAKALSCGRWSRDLLPFISTAAVARDMDAIRAHLGEDVLNFWGFSYGSFLGTVYSQMFPDRVGRLIVDGVMDATTYITSFAEFTLNNLVDTNSIFDGFTKECEAAGPSRCALASTQNKTSVEKVVKKLIKDLQKDPVLVVEDFSFPIVISADVVLGLLFGGYYGPSFWPTLAEALAGLVEGDPSLVAGLISRGSGPSSNTCPISDDSGSNGFTSVVCVDTVGNDMSLGKWKKLAEKNKEISEWFGERWTMQALACKYWPATAAERYTGPWNKTLKNKVLIIGNRYDPVTPLRSARIVERVMNGNGVLLTREGYGHCSTSMLSFCTLKHVRDYFVNGTLPVKGTICGTDGDLFPDKFAVMDAEMVKRVEEVESVQTIINAANRRL